VKVLLRATSSATRGLGLDCFRFIRSHPKDRYPHLKVEFEPATQGSLHLCPAALTTAPRGQLFMTHVDIRLLQYAWRWFNLFLVKQNIVYVYVHVVKNPLTSDVFPIVDLDCLKMGRRLHFFRNLDRGGRLHLFTSVTESDSTSSSRSTQSGCLLRLWVHTLCNFAKFLNTCIY
jgi:hypothetical protein